ncbi:MAG: mRNA surveillance protein pelota [Nanoarchaeota archaeon]|nr:mRNA surveillance protein pelota [Nanoarchaeota archaeon]
MKIIHKDLKNGEIKFRITNPDDLWFLSHIIESGDLVKGKATRKIKVGADKKDVAKKTFFLAIEVEKLDFQPKVLRVSGIIKSGPEEVTLGSHQSFNLEVNSELTLIKKKWLKHQLQKLDDAVKERADILICTLDRENATFALLKPQGYSIVSTLEGEVEKKGFDQVSKDFYAQIAKQLEEYVERYKPSKVIVASPSVWRENISGKISVEMKKKIIFATCASGGKRGIDEVLKSEELKRTLQEDRVTKEVSLVEDLLTRIAKNGKSSYGFDEIRKCVEAGAVETLMIVDKFLFESKEKGKYNALDKLMQQVERIQGKVFIISYEHEAGKKLYGLGGIGALLRYKID